MTETQEKLLAFLRAMVWPDGQRDRVGLAYNGPADFLLKHGRWYEPIAVPKGIRKGAPKACFGNAMMVCALHDLPYVEGYAISPHFPDTPFEHAWNCPPGRLHAVDNTWWTGRGKPEGLAYFGVEFNLARAFDCVWHAEQTVIDDWQRYWPLLKNIWEGETKTAGDASKIREALRSRDRKKIAALMRG